MSRELKIEAARAALDFVKPGMRLGIGTGSTADEFIRLLGERVKAGMEIIGVPTSERTAALCRECGIALTTLDETPRLDLTIDGADEIDPQLRLIKGGGGALLREKIVAAASESMVVIADRSKLVATLGAFPLPIEVNPFGLGATNDALQRLAASLGLAGSMRLREDGEGKPYRTDGGHYIIDASFGRIQDAERLASGLKDIPGVVQHGLFIGLAKAAIVADADGVEVIRPA